MNDDFPEKDLEEMTAEEREAAEMESLKARAKQLNIRVSPKIGLEKLREKVNAAVEGADIEDDEDDLDEEEIEADQPAKERKFSKLELRKKMRAEGLALVRVRITNMNPDKADMQGDFFTFSNKHVGTVRKYIPFSPDYAPDGYHVERVLLNMLRGQKFLAKKATPHPVTKKIQVTTRFMPEFAIEELPPLTPRELKQLELRQAAAAGATGYGNI